MIILILTTIFFYLKNMCYDTSVKERKKLGSNILILTDNCQHKIYFTFLKRNIINIRKKVLIKYKNFKKNILLSLKVT